jgi:hypothetical protein
MLQIGIDDDRRVAAHVAEAGGDGQFLAEIAAERDRGDAGVAVVDGTQPGKRFVGRAVVDEQISQRSDS